LPFGELSASWCAAIVTPGADSALVPESAALTVSTQAYRYESDPTLSFYFALTVDWVIPAARSPEWVIGIDVGISTLSTGAT
jgi:hypothetical protein